MQQPTIIPQHQSQHPFVYHPPQVVMGQHVGINNGPMEPIHLQTAQTENNNLPVTTLSKISMYVKENVWLVAQWVAAFIMVCFCVAAIVMHPVVGGVMAFVILLPGLGCLIAAYKKKYLALSFLSGSLLLEFIISSIVFFFFGPMGQFHGDGSYFKNPVFSLSFQIPNHILQLSFLAISIVLTVKIYKQVHSTSISPVLNPVAASTFQEQENYSRLQDEQESQYRVATQNN